MPAPEAARVLTLDLTRDANDIWDRIRRGFGMPDLDSERVMDQQGFYLNRPRFLKQVFERGGRYLYYIVDELERRGMPTEIALLPMVESSYNPMAYSRAHASGLWQFIPSTGKHYNLTQDPWVDERRDVIASTNAALDYLQRIYEMHGDWHLALASYNWGEGAVQRALKRNAEDGLPLEYKHLRMPDETRNYVPKLQAIKNIVSEPELFHFELPYVANELHFVSVEAPVGVDLATAAKLSGDAAGRVPRPQPRLQPSGGDHAGADLHRPHRSRRAAAAGPRRARRGRRRMADARDGRGRDPRVGRRPPRAELGRAAQAQRPRPRAASRAKAIRCWCPTASIRTARSR